ncbi:MAG TPA: T9SS type A sorting domain-containing protein [Flavobacteriaceae bacterium]|nr:T9SS type A sorting domain-containing protein [Flavobacteriaceae bacterium]
MKKIFFISTLLLSLASIGQNIDNFCGTEVPENYLSLLNNNKDLIEKYEREYYELKKNRTSTAITNVPVKIHVVTQASGETPITESEIIAEIQEANSYLINSFLEMTVCEDINYIADNNLYEFDTADQGQLYSYHQPNILNIYFVESITSGGNGICGYTYLPGNSSQYYDVIVMDNQCTTNASGDTLLHEFGHHWNLIHTHGTTNGTLTDELVNGSNCSTAGDRICDTPADPQLNGSNVSNVSCVFTGNDTDAQGQPFDPDTSNIMSYSPQSCTNTLSDGQFARMYAGFHTFKSYYECPSFNVDFTSVENQDCDDNMSVDFTDTSFGAVSWQWDVNGDDVIDYTTQDVSHTYTPGDYDVTLTITNSSSSSITKVYPNYISYDSSIYETTKVFATIKVVNGVDQNTWEFTDSLGAIIDSGGPYSASGEYTHELDVVQSECYTFTIYDTQGDGLSNNNNLAGAAGQEWYELKTDDNILIHTNTDFGSEENTQISTNYLGLLDINTNNFSIYPNPSDYMLTIKTNGYSIPDKYSIIDFNGRVISDKIIHSESDLSISINLLESGVYFLKIISKGKEENIKFIIK